MVYLEACIILTASHQTMTYSSISYSSWIPIPSSLFSSSRPPSSKPHSNAPPLIPRATNSRRAPRTPACDRQRANFNRTRRIGEDGGGEGTRSSVVRLLQDARANLSCPPSPRSGFAAYDEGEGIELRRALHASIGDELERTARGGGEKRSSASTQHEDREAKLRAIKQL